MDPLQILEALKGDHKPSDAELTSAVDQLREALDIATSDDRPDLELARDLRAAIDTVRAEQVQREEALAEARAEAAKLREGILDDKAEDKADDDDKAEADAGAEVVAEAEKIAAEAPEPVAASMTILERLRAREARLRAEAPKEMKSTAPGIELKPIGPAAGFTLDQDAGFDQLGHLFSTHAKSAMTKGEDVRLLRLTRHYDDSRTLGPNFDLNNRKIADVFGFGEQRPVTAAGGLCGPGDVDHSHPICGERGRPVRDSWASFNASRGRVNFHPSAAIGDLSSAVSIWTAETDADPGDTVKPCPPVACPEELFCEIDAVTRCLTIGNFQARFSPELWASRLELLLIEHDRAAEQKAIKEMHAASQVLTLVDEGDVITSIMSSLNRTIAYDRSVNRTGSSRYRVTLDAWVKEAMRNQVLRNLGVANNVETLQLADATIAGWFAAENADVTWTHDGTLNDTTDTHNVLTDPNSFLAQTTMYVAPADAFLFLDGGTLDLGTNITDSQLNATNDRQAFAETFEKLCFRGCSSYAVPVAIGTGCGCPVDAAPEPGDG